MKLSTLIGVLGVVSTTDALSFGMPLMKEIKQSIFKVDVNTETIDGDAPKEFDFLAEQRKKLGNIKESFNEDVVYAWEEMQKKLSPQRLQRKIDEYNSQFKVSSENMNNRVKETFKSYSSGDDFEVLSADRFADHTLRIKETNPEVLGLDTVKQYTGYLDVNDLDKHFFYWFFESRNDPENDPVILWLNGGPGCSSATGLFFELGPSSINATLQPEYNPYSWNSNASVIFLDQPVGVGYSYTNGEEVKSTASAAKDVFVFLELFFQKFPQFVKNPFHIAGESYAGHYIPSFASEIINHADRSFDLSSVLIGNGITDSLIQSAYYKPMACGEGGYKQVITDKECERMEKDYPRCAALTKICYDAPNALTCVPANFYCEERLFGPFQKTGLNPYDIRTTCKGDLCYEALGYVDEYLNLDFVKNVVGASNIEMFNSCDDTVFRNFLFSGDGPKPFQQYVAELLDKNIPVLIYAGDKDFICNWLGNHGWSDALEYTGHGEFESKPLQPWYTSDKKLAGEVKNHGIFTFLRIYDAGHMVPYDQPENALDMVNRWIQGDYSYGY
ncbi:DEHA2D02244p [Debaryomyces hansenii CBS767]|uniref:Carboxypeptidase n=1 Tax=Debaryomyces hansenii (strain ATCC 36239 / CBS 767 / BCRC 21394 / JCM 1990 / NBRC 0083 / IGC 2968) TaxID=284592 RepID=Q6BTA5_DEBHA|nr:DEHA2D02244p [Debaryomyces hansenii CBS767]CAG86697.2 DEHA2D02244p [Debaryomyces hansenii CBS767]|eukprot:XP_458565.2 DEHA2D02244p [Debaryomyces hansenii CBS767]